MLGATSDIFKEDLLRTRGDVRSLNFVFVRLFISVPLGWQKLCFRYRINKIEFCRYQQACNKTKTKIELRLYFSFSFITGLSILVRMTNQKSVDQSVCC